MSDAELLLKEIKDLPSGYMGEVLDFVGYLKQKQRPAEAAYSASSTPRTLEEAKKEAAAKATDPERKPFSSLIGSLPGIFGGDGVVYQQKLRDEWDG
jgi:hypothetical protein